MKTMLNTQILPCCGSVGLAASAYQKYAPLPMRMRNHYRLNTITISIIIYADSWRGNECEGSYTKRYRHYYYH